jgi:hypothetical protein
MASIIIGSQNWNTRGIVLTNQSAQEQVNGLVTVSVQYVMPASRKAELDRFFYVDAPPPIWPEVVNRGELLTNNLYMVERSIERSNGLINVTASYVSGLQRLGSQGYFLREMQETNKRGTAYNYWNSNILWQSTGTFSSIAYLAPVVATPSGGTANVTFGLGFVFTERVKLVEFVRIGSAFAAKLPTFTRSDIASLIQQSGGAFSQFDFGSPDTTSASDVWVVEGNASTAAQRSFEKTTPVGFTETSNYITPSVEIVTLDYRLVR